MRAWWMAAALLAPALAAAGVGPGGAGEVVVRVRLEGSWEHLWSGPVALGGTFTLQAGNSGRVHVLDARTPLGALAAAAAQAGLDLEVSDEYADLVVLAIGGDAWFGTRWWDYRVDWIEPNYGPQHQWLAWGPGLRGGAEVLWYLDGFGTTPLRMAPLSTAGADPGGGVPGVAGGAGAAPCAQAARVESPAVDVVHQPGQPWPPPPLWRPVPAARLAGGVQGPVVAGAGLGVGPGGPFWAEEVPLPISPLVHYIRSPRAPGCGPGPAP